MILNVALTGTANVGHDMTTSMGSDMIANVDIIIECIELLGKTTIHEPPGIRVKNEKCDTGFQNFSLKQS